MFGFILFFIIIGLFFALAPAFVWFIVIGWLLKDGEPSDAALIVFRGIGYIILFIAAMNILAFFFGIS